MPNDSKNSIYTMILIVVIQGIFVSGASAVESVQPLTLNQTVISARKNDPWLIGNQHEQDAIESLSIVAGTLPDPKLSLGLANIASDTFDFNQEGMTQFKTGISQLFPRGDSLEIKREQLSLMGSQYPYQREDRKAQLTVVVARLWMDAYKAQESIALIDKDRALFEQLADVAEASYSAALGRTRQQDIVRAQLELTRLDDRLTVLKLQQESTWQRLSEWLSEYIGGGYSQQAMSEAKFNVSSILPDIQILDANLFADQVAVEPQILFEHLSSHPAVLAVDQKIKASRSGIELAKQNYKPEWGVNASYGVRRDADNGADRSDLFSLGVTIDLPFFTANRQDKQLSSAVSSASAVETEKWLLIRQMVAAIETNHFELSRLNERRALYKDRLLPQMHDQAEASLTAYTNDDGDFAEVVRARIAELNATIDDLGIRVDRQKSIIQLNYYFMKQAEAITSTQLSASTSGEEK